MVHENFLLVLSMSAPVVRNHALTLDAILGGMLFRDGVPGAEAARCDMIDRVSIGGYDIPMASEMILSADYRTSSYKPSRSMDRTMQMVPSMFSRVDGKLPNRKNFSKEIDYIFDTTHRMIETKEVRFYGRGDVQAIDEILDRYSGIGSHTARGFGEFEMRDFEMLPEADEHFCLHDGTRLLRPVPEAVVKELNIPRGGHVIASGNYQNPYSPKLAARFGVSHGLIATPKHALVL